MNVYILEGDITDMQGPCPSGFHVPTNDEWTSIKNAGISLGAWSSSSGTGLNTYLKMPYAGYRYSNSTDGGVTGQAGCYWSCTGDSDSAYRFFFYSSGFVQGTRAKSEGLSIRGIANIPVIPDSSWTRTYTGTGTAGIYYNSDLGLISISSDGTTWYTLMDKNIGATTVFNYGDTLTVANTGNLFQWGNNYGFPGTLSSDTITTSPTQVDASSYGPGNYYSSSTWITTNPCDSSNNDNLRGGVTGIVSTAALKDAYIGEYVPPYLCFTANTAGSTVQLQKNGSPTSVTLETSTDGNNWNSYTIGNTITLSNIGDKVYFRNTSETDTGFSTARNQYYKFEMTGSVAGSGDVTSLLNKNLTNTLVDNCFYYLFYQCSSLTTAPKLPATTLAESCYSSMFSDCTGLTLVPELPATNLARWCYNGMFSQCTGLTSIPKLPATVLAEGCYQVMFSSCSNIRLSTSQTGIYQTAYRIPSVGTGVTATNALWGMFSSTGGTFTGTPSINTTYYTSNTVV